MNHDVAWVVVCQLIQLAAFAAGIKLQRKKTKMEAELKEQLKKDEIANPVLLSEYDYWEKYDDELARIPVIMFSSKGRHAVRQLASFEHIKICNGVILIHEILRILLFRFEDQHSVGHALLFFWMCLMIAVVIDSGIRLLSAANDLRIEWMARV